MRTGARLPVILAAILAVAASAPAASAASHKPSLRGRHHDSDADGGSKSKGGKARRGRHAAAEAPAALRGRHGAAREDDRPCSRWEIRHHRCEAVAQEPSRRTASRGRGGREAVELLPAASRGVAKAGAPASPPPSVHANQVVLEDGQTLADIAARTGVSARDLATLNGLSLTEEPPTGATIKLPPVLPPATGAASPTTSLAQANPGSTTPRAVSPMGSPVAPAGGPRPYAVLGPEPGAPVAPARTGRWSRTEADALAAYQVASARAPSLAGRPDATHNRFVWPLKGEVASGFGAHGTGQRNDGLDFAARPGDPVRAAAAGEVVYAGKEIAGVGNLVLLKHADGWVTAYSHLGRITVAMRQTVDQGQEVAEAAAGDGGAAPPVHFEVRQPGAGGAKPVDPASVLPAREGATGRG